MIGLSLKRLKFYKFVVPKLFFKGRVGMVNEFSVSKVSIGPLGEGAV